MAKIRNTFDGGSNATGMTTGNTGGSSGDAFTAVEVALTFSNEQAHTGTLSAKPPVAAVTGYGRWQTTAERNWSTRFYAWFTATHTADYIFAEQRVTSSSGTGYLRVLVNPASQLRLRNIASATDIWTAAAAIPLNQWVRVEVQSQQGTTTSDGQARIAYYLGNSTTPVEASAWITGQNFRGDTGAATNILVGKNHAGAYSGSAYFDTIGINTGTDSAGFIGPIAIATLNSYRFSSFRSRTFQYARPR